MNYNYTDFNKLCYLDFWTSRVRFWLGLVLIFALLIFTWIQMHSYVYLALSRQDFIVTSIHNIFFFFLKIFIYSFMRDTEREWQRHRQREKQAPRREPDAGLDPGSPGSCPGPKAALNHWASGAALLLILKGNLQGRDKQLYSEIQTDSRSAVVLS